MALLQLEQVEKFLTLLTGSADSLNTWQLFYDPKDGTKRSDLASTYTAMLKQATPSIKRAENNLQGVYMCINETDGKGRHVENITRIRTLFADFDGQAEPAWPIPPHFVTKRDDTHGHAYWLVSDVDVDEFMYFQRRIAMACDTDLQVIDPARVARVPGTVHLKDPNSPQMYTVTTDNQLQGRYTKQQILDTFILTPEKQAEYDRWCESRQSLGTGSGFDDLETYRRKFTNFLVNSAEPAVQGSGSATLIRVVSYAHDHGLPVNVAQELAWEHYNPRCVPPWQPHEQHHFDAVIERAYRYARNEPGCKTATAAFMDAPPIVPAPPKKKPAEIVRDGDRLGEKDAAIMSPMLTAKSSHYELAQALDGTLYDGRKLIRCKKVWYAFNGKSWAIIDDDVIKSQVQRFYARFKPSDTLVRGIYNSLSDLVNVEHVENGTWLDSGKPAENIICFQNGLVDFTDNTPKMMEHTSNYFTFNEVDYNYNPSATAPMWAKLLNDIFDHDPELIEQLQEWFGYCLTNDTTFQKCAILIGKSRAGKGVITRILTAIVGASNTCSPLLSNITKDSMLHTMSTKSLGLIPDAHSVNKNNADNTVSTVKSIVGNDELSYHMMYKGTQTSRFKIRLVMSTNNMPDFNDASGAFANRMLVFPFIKSFAGREDLTLEKRLAGEIEGIAQWALAGLVRLRKNGRFTEAASGREEKESIKAEMNPISRFTDEVCVLNADAFVIADRLYDSYLLWCKQHHVTAPMSQLRLNKIFKSSDMPVRMVRKRIDGERHYGFEGVNVISFPGLGSVEEKEGA